MEKYTEEHICNEQKILTKMAEEIEDKNDFFSLAEARRGTPPENNGIHKCYQKVKREEEKYMQQVKEIDDLVSKTASPAQFFTFALGVLLFKKGMINIGDVAVCFLYSRNVFTKVFEIIYNINLTKIAQPLLDKVDFLFNLKNRVRTQVFPDTYTTYDIKISHLNFSYPNKPIFKNFNLTIPYGSKVLIKADPKKGKTTFLNFLLGIRNDYSGSIKINDMEIKYIKEPYLLDIYSIGMQKTVFINGLSLKYNITLDMNVDEKNLKQVIEITGLEKIIKKLDHGIDEIIFDDGRRFSLEERQIIFLARALFGHHKILLLDESFVGISFETEKEIKEKLFKLDMTIIETSHDNKILDGYSQIVFL